MNEFLKGKNVVVTGGASGIGRSVAEVFADSGARVSVADLSLEQAALVAEGLPGTGHHAIRIDVTDPDSVSEAFSECGRQFGTIDGVVNCAGIWKPRDDGPISRVTNQTWDQIIAVNLTGTFNVCREAVRVMEPQGSGSIITIASVVAITGWERLNAYSASKGGVLALSRALAVECGSKGIRVNCICPGVIETPMTEKVLAYSQPTVLPIGRLGRPEDIARTAAFLCSDWSGFTTAATVVVDGGFSAA